MNRRDVIVVAVLINAGLLVVLFASALKSKDDKPELAVQSAPAVQSVPVVQNEVQPPRGDEVDQVLSQFASTLSKEPSTLGQATTTPVLTPPALENQAPLPSLSSDLPSLTPPQPVTTSAPEAKEKLAEASFKEVKVKKGDALEKIARAHHTTVQEIMRANKLASTQLKVGQILKIPTKTSKVASSAVSHDSQYYIVKNGDNPWTIAVKNHIKVDELLKLNNLDEEKARKLKPGDQLRIR